MTTHGLPVPAIDMRTYAAEYCSHRHDYHQIVLPLRGMLELDTSRGSRLVDAGTGVVIPAGEHHGFSGCGANRFVVVDIAADNHARLFERCLREPAVAIDRGVRHHLAFVTERLAQGSLSDHFRRHWAALLIDSLEAPEGTAARSASLFARATAWIDNHLRAELYTRDVAAAIGLSPARVRTLFQEQAGCSPREWIAAARLDHATRQLRSTNRAIADIALASGFSDQSAFTRAFSRMHGEPPARWRRQRSGSREH